MGKSFINFRHYIICMYIRAKLINGKYYYYLVESERAGGRIAQKILAHLGGKEETAAYANKARLY